MNIFESLLRRVEELERRINNTVREGRVEEVDAQKGYRVAIAESDDGPVKTTWIKGGENAGSLTTWAPMKKGQKVKLISPNGEIGASSLVLPHNYSDGHDQPSQNLEEPMLKTAGVTLRFSAGGLVIEGNLIVNGGSVKHNDHEIGAMHKHKNTQPGGGQSGEVV